MPRRKRTFYLPYQLILLFLMASAVNAQPDVAASSALNWEQIKARFLAQNPSVMAGQLTIDEAKANEITAGLRPNPQFDLSASGFQLFPGAGPFRPLSSSQFVPGVTLLI